MVMLAAAIILSAGYITEKFAPEKSVKMRYAGSGAPAAVGEAGSSGAAGGASKAPPAAPPAALPGRLSSSGCGCSSSSSRLQLGGNRQRQHQLQMLVSHVGSKSSRGSRNTLSRCYASHEKMLGMMELQQQQPGLGPLQPQRYASACMQPLQHVGVQQQQQQWRARVQQLAQRCMVQLHRVVPTPAGALQAGRLKAC